MIGEQSSDTTPTTTIITSKDVIPRLKPYYWNTNDYRPYNRYRPKIPKKSILYNPYNNASLKLLGEIMYDLDKPYSKYKYINRGGIIFYTIYEDQLYMCFGKDRKTGDLTDFGGIKQARENVVQCAFREGNEESRNAFGKIIINGDSRKYVSLINNKMLIVFVPVITNSATINIFTESTNNFNNATNLPHSAIDPTSGKLRDCYNEVEKLVWLSEADLMNILSDNPTYKMYSSVRQCILSCEVFSSDIRGMKYALSNNFNFKYVL